MKLLQDITPTLIICAIIAATIHFAESRVEQRAASKLHTMELEVCRDAFVAGALAAAGGGVNSPYSNQMPIEVELMWSNYRTQIAAGSCHTESAALEGLIRALGV